MAVRASCYKAFKIVEFARRSKVEARQGFVPFGLVQT
jgi:hypothetical protein